MAYDLTHTLCKFLDKHLILPLLQWQLEQEDPIFDPDSIRRAQLAVVSKTKMVEFAGDLHKQVNDVDDVPEELAKEAEVVFQKLQDVIEKEGKLYARLVETDRDKIAPEDLGSFLSHIQFRMDCGQYEPEQQVADHLQLYRELASYLNLPDEAQNAARWGILAACILQAQWAENSDEESWNPALLAYQDLQESIDLVLFQDQLLHLTQRAWLMHWGLFVFSNVGDGHNLLINSFVKEKWLNTIQTCCPHLLRYLAASLIIVFERTTLMDEIVRTIEEEKENYRDPITEFLRCLRYDFDFEGAEKALRQCAEVIDHDFFLTVDKSDFFESAQLLFFRTFCSVHRRVDVRDLSHRLGLDLTPEEAEEWAVSLIEKLDMKAKIDSQNKHIVLTHDEPSIYEQVLSKTKALDRRFEDMLSQLSRKSRV